MRRCLIISAVLMSACGPDPAAPSLALLDLAPCPGWTGRPPTTEGDFARAAATERAGRLCANSKLEDVMEAAADLP